VILLEKQNQLPGQFYGSEPLIQTGALFCAGRVGASKKDWDEVIRIGE
jgi:hypothetical protein